MIMVSLLLILPDGSDPRLESLKGVLGLKTSQKTAFLSRRQRELIFTGQNVIVCI